MILPLYHTPSSLPLPPKTLNSQFSSPIPFSFFSQSPFSKSLISHKISKFLIHSSTSTTDILPKSAIQRIADKLRSLGYTEPEPQTETKRPQHGDVASAGEIFVPLPNRLPKYRVGHTIDPSWSTPENPVPRPGSGRAISRYHDLRNVVEEEKRVAARSKEKDREKVPTLAELSLKEGDLRRLRSVGLKVRKKLKVGKAGITEGVVNGIHERWRREEVVKLACEDLCKMNMKMTHEILERKTGGLVVWRSGGTIILYRGDNYKYPYFLAGNYTTNDTTHEVSVDSRMNYVRDGNRECYSSNMVKVKSGGINKSNNIVQPSIVKGVGSPNRVRFQLPGEAQIADEADRLLDGLGPRFTDWWGYEPLPIDADLLPAVVPGYRKPFRLLPYGLAPKLTNDEMIILRGLGKPLPCHFALGRNRNLQGLAAAIVKLWEKCEIAKVAIKRGVQNTNNELMAEELKRLTGGTLLSRDREFIVLYRGKDFLPLAVSSAIEERRKLGLHGEKQRIAFSSSMVEKEGSGLMTNQHAPENKPHKAGTHKQNIILSEENALNSTETSIRRTTFKLSSVLERKARAEQLLAELEKAEIPQEPEIDKEGITAEERYMLRKVGLRMKPFLLLGRRGVFDGTVENMHLHWKYRELVKIISHQRRIDDLHGIARTLEAESGGILVAVERVNKGHAIIVYRGKNYNRPENLRPKTLLNKREAMKRSVEAQRRESLKLHILKLNKSIDGLKLDLVKGKEIHDTQAVDNSTQPSGEDRLEGSSTSTNSDHGMDASSNNPQAIRLDDEQITLSSTNDDTDTESESSFGTVMNQIETSIDLRSESVSVDSSSRPDISPTLDPPRSSSATREVIPRVYSDEMTESTSTSQAAQNKWERSNGLNMNSRNRSDPVDTTSGPNRPQLSGQTSTSPSIIRMGSRVSFKRSKESSDRVSKTKLERSSHKVVENRSNGVPVRVTALTNKERLLLRKQALMTKQRPVLAIGKSNIVTGVAKAIKTHFIKHPLAIVNVKGRAKGTSVQEVVFKLEQATGAVLVSQEPSKVILYRGWGADEERNKANKKMETEGQFMKPTVSPELLAAIKLECGLQSAQVEDSTHE